MLLLLTIIFSYLASLSSVKQEYYGKHPLEKIEKLHYDRDQYRHLTVLRSVQGIHAPLRLLAERKAAANVGHLPFLPRSNVMLEVLDGRDELITPNDIFAGKCYDESWTVYIGCLLLDLIRLFFPPSNRSTRIQWNSFATTHDYGASKWLIVSKLIIVLMQHAHTHRTWENKHCMACSNWL